MPMTKAQAIAELEHIYEILPLIAEAVKEEKKPINQYGKTSYFRDMYGQSMGTVKNRKEGIRREIRSGRYPESALIERSEKLLGILSTNPPRTKAPAQ